MQYSHSYEDQNGQIVDVMIDDEPDEIRNARDHRGGDHRSGGHRTPPPSRHHPPPGRPTNPGTPGRVIVRQPSHHNPHQPGPIQAGGEYVTIRRSAIAELIPVAGKLWASLLAQPDPPQAVGDDIIDRDNAALHRSALAAHQQNQTRILALTDLAARAVKLFV